MHVLLDLYGVLLEHEKTFRGYRDRLAALLAARFGGEAEDWRRARERATQVSPSENTVGGRRRRNHHRRDRADLVRTRRH